MKKEPFVLAVIAVALSLFACSKPASESVSLLGRLDGIDADTVIFARVEAEVYDYVTPIDTLLVREDGTFSFSSDTLAADLYALAPLTDRHLNNYLVYTFLQKGETRVVLSVSPHDYLMIQSEGTPLADQYQSYLDKRRDAGHREVLDSLDNLFYRARSAHDDTEMARIKRASDPYYGQSHTDMEIYTASLLADLPTDLFGVYLYYTYSFPKYSLATMEEIQKVESDLEHFDPDTKESPLYRRITDTLHQASLSCVGATAPELSGLTLSGDTLHLSDLRGKYVLVDFWSSGCTWCRAETPNLKHTYADFGGDHFTILGVSTDFYEKDWRQAVAEDGADWSHILLDNEMRKSSGRSYNISGIPLILLIDPEGKIIERGLRGDSIHEAVETALSNK